MLLFVQLRVLESSWQASGSIDLLDSHSADADNAPQAWRNHSYENLDQPASWTKRDWLGSRLRV